MLKRVYLPKISLVIIAQACSIGISSGREMGQSYIYLYNFISNKIFFFSVSTVLPVMLSSKLLPEMEIDDNSKREQLLLGMQNMPISTQIDKLKVLSH